MVRQKLGRESIEPYLRDNLAERSKLVECHFEAIDIALKEKSNGLLVDISRPAVIVKDINSFLEYVVKYRSFDATKLLVKLGLDGGQGFFKVTLNVSSTDDQISSSSTLQDTGVKKLFIICIVPDIAEIYENVQIIMRKLDLGSLKHVVTTDLKLANILVGIQSHGAQHPCCYCESTSSVWESAQARTLGTVRNNYLDWYKKGSKPQEAKAFKNCIHLPLINGPDNASIIDLVPPPELHLLMGPFNHIYKNMKKIWPDVDNWASRFHVKEVGYHGGGFIGGDCNKLLKNVDTLEQMCPLSIFPYVKVLRKFRSVVEACYGHELSPTMDYDISTFSMAYKELEISITPKLHIVFDHVPQYCKAKGSGLGVYSEQAVESVHCKFRLFWARRKINSLSNPRYLSALHDSVVEFNSHHL